MNSTADTIVVSVLGGFILLYFAIVHLILNRHWIALYHKYPIEFPDNYKQWTRCNLICGSDPEEANVLVRILDNGVCLSTGWSLFYRHDVQIPWCILTYDPSRNCNYFSVHILGRLIDFYISDTVITKIIRAMCEKEHDLSLP